MLNGSIMDVRRLKTLAKTSDSAVCLLYCKYFLYLWERSATQNHSQLLSAPFSLFKISIYWLIGMFVGWLKFCFYFGSCMILIYHHLLSLFVPPYLFLLFVVTSQCQHFWIYAANGLFFLVLLSNHFELIIIIYYIEIFVVGWLESRQKIIFV